MQSSLKLLLFLSSVWQLLTIASAQEIPAIACPQYFQYLRYGNQYIGKITLPNLTTGNTRVEVRFSQRQSVVSNYYGKLSLYEGEMTTLNKLERGQPISYRVDFPLRNAIPKMTRLTVNGYELCAARDYPAPSTYFNLQHNLQATSSQPLFNSYNEYPVQQHQHTNQISNNNDYRTTVKQNNVVYTVKPSNPFFTTSRNTRPPTARPTFVYNETPQPQPPKYNVPQDFYSVSPVSQVPIAVHHEPTVPVISTIPTVPTVSRPGTSPSSAISNGECGREGEAGFSPLIHGGSVINKGQFPWLTAIKRKEAGGSRFLCGGSLISTQTVLTAAHCFKLLGLTAERIVVYLGWHDLENYSENGVEQREIRTLITHPDYSKNALSDADIALLLLRIPVVYSLYIRPICLWNEPDDLSRILGQKGYVAGWGADEAGNLVSSVPKMVDNNIVTESTCAQSDGIKSQITSRTLCAGNRDGTGPCMGDSGGGLMIKRNGSWKLRGIVSLGQTLKGQCNLKEFVVYCDVAKHISWVRSKMLN